MTPLFVGYPVVMTYDVSYVLYLGSRLSALWNCRVDGGNSNSANDRTSGRPGRARHKKYLISNIFSPVSQRIQIQQPGFQRKPQRCCSDAIAKRYDRSGHCNTTRARTGTGTRQERDTRARAVASAAPGAALTSAGGFLTRAPATAHGCSSLSVCLTVTLATWRNANQGVPREKGVIKRALNSHHG